MLELQKQEFLAFSKSEIMFIKIFKKNYVYFLTCTYWYYIKGLGQESMEKMSTKETIKEVQDEKRN
jgi:hypothetical protein